MDIRSRLIMGLFCLEMLWAYNSLEPDVNDVYRCIFFRVAIVIFIMVEKVMPAHFTPCQKFYKDVLILLGSSSVDFSANKSWFFFMKSENRENSQFPRAKDDLFRLHILSKNSPKPDHI